MGAKITPRRPGHAKAAPFSMKKKPRHESEMVPADFRKAGRAVELMEAAEMFASMRRAPRSLLQAMDRIDRQWEAERLEVEA